MGYGIFIKDYTDKLGKVALLYKVYSSEGVFKKTIPGIKINPKDFDLRRYRVKTSCENHIAVNTKLTETTTLLSKGWDMYTSGQLSWDELINFMGGKKSTVDLPTLILPILEKENTAPVYKGIKEAYGAAKKVLGRELTYKDLTETTFNTIILDWKKRLRSKTLKTYKYHLGLIAKAAYDRKLIYYQYKPLKKWRAKKDKLNVKGNPWVETAKPEEYLKAIKLSSNMMHINALGFWLLSFGLRGLYPTDFCSMHQFADEVDFNNKTHGASFYLKHMRHKTDEIMWMQVSENPWGKLIQKLRYWLEFTHGDCKHPKTGKLLRKTKENLLAQNDDEGWFFRDYNKDTWGTINKQLTKLDFPSLKTARKTFNTVALTLEISEETRKRLIGQGIDGVQRNYQDWEWKVLQDKINKAHINILKAFKTDKLYKALTDKADKILEDKYGVS